MSLENDCLEHIKYFSEEIDFMLDLLTPGIDQESAKTVRERIDWLKEKRQEWIDQLPLQKPLRARSAKGAIRKADCDLNL